MRARYYDPTTGQFLTVDPLVVQTGQPYSYTAGDPINDVDPTGDGPLLGHLATCLSVASLAFSGCVDTLDEYKPFLSEPMQRLVDQYDQVNDLLDMLDEEKKELEDLRGPGSQSLLDEIRQGTRTLRFENDRITAEVKGEGSTLQTELEMDELLLDPGAGSDKGDDGGLPDVPAGLDGGE
jgi:hypothetical protein